MEYPSYGIYKDLKECTADQILQDSETIYKFLKKKCFF